MGNEGIVERKCCPVCRQTRTAELYRCPFSAPPINGYLTEFYREQGGVEFDCLEKDEYVLVECLGCGLIYQRHILGDALMRKLYEEWIDPRKALEINLGAQCVQTFAKLSREIELTLGLFPAPPHKLQLLDFGMGWGEWCSMAKSYGCNAHGLELSKTRVERAMQSGIKVLSWAEVSSYRYDFINIEQVVEHLPNPVETLQYLTGALKPDGILKISVPNGWDIKSKLRCADWSAPRDSPHSLNSVAPLEHINCFTHDTMLELAAKVGLRRFRVTTRMALKGLALDVNLRESLRPAYDAFRIARSFGRWRSTRLYFQRQKAA